MRQVRWGVVAGVLALLLGCSGDLKLAYSWACQSTGAVTVDGTEITTQGYGRRYFYAHARWVSHADCAEDIEAAGCPSCRVEVTSPCRVYECREVPPKLW